MRRRSWSIALRRPTATSQARGLAGGAGFPRERRRRERLLQPLLRQVEVAHQPDQRGERLGPVAAEGAVEVGAGLQG